MYLGPLRPSWRMRQGYYDGQLVLSGLTQFSAASCFSRAPRLSAAVYPWQADPSLPYNITIDTSHHHPRLLQAPDGWEVWQRNGRVWIAESNRRVAMLDAAQYGMLLAMSRTDEDQHPRLQPDWVLVSVVRRRIAKIGRAHV